MRFSSIRAKTISDSRSEDTIEISVSLESGASTSASVPQGKSKGKHGAVYLPPQRARESVEGKIASALRGARLEKCRREIDRALIALDGTKNKSRLGANAAPWRFNRCKPRRSR